MKHAVALKTMTLFLVLPASTLVQAGQDADVPTTQAVAVSNTEMTWSPQLKQIGVPAAWLRGATGLNVKVSVIDTGVNSKNIDLSKNLLRGYNVVSTRTTTDTTDYVGHGTHVSGIIAALANNMGSVGVAPEAKILPIRVADKWGNMTYAAIDRGLRIAADNTPIANVSLGGGPGALSGMQYAVSKGLLVVAAAGNDGGADPIWPARYAKESWAMGRIIAVGAVDQNNAMPTWSNRAGDTRNFYLVAPGVDIVSTYQSGHAYMSGTSMAAPHVAGVAALIKSWWPKLKAEEIASIMFRTATDLGEPGVDAVYGWGLVNADRAMQPLGATVLAAPSGGKKTLASTSLKLPKGSVTASQIQSLIAVGTDDFGRGFAFDLAQTLRNDPAPTLEAALNDSDRRYSVVEKVLADGSRYAVGLAQSTALPLSPIAQFEARARSQSVSGFSWVGHARDGSEWAVGGNGYAHHFFGAMSELPATREAGAAFANPVFSLVAGHSHVGYSLGLADGWKMKAGLLTTAAAGAFTEQEAPGALPLKSSLALGSISRARDASALTFSVGQLTENESLLGSRSGAGLRIDGTPRTRFASLEGAWQLGEGWAAHASYTAAISPAYLNTTDSLIAGSTNLRATAASLGLMRADTWRRGDRFGLSISQPLRIASGGLRLMLPQGEDDAGTPRFASEAVSLAPLGRELRTELHYLTPLAGRASLSAFFMHRAQPGHDASAPDDVSVGLRWANAF